jgi:hypothetical protein
MLLAELPLSLLTQPGKIYCYLFSKIVTNVVQWLILVPFSPSSPKLIQNLSGIQLTVGFWFFWIYMSSLQENPITSKIIFKYSMFHHEQERQHGRLLRLKADQLQLLPFFLSQMEFCIRFHKPCVIAGPVK